MKTVKRLSDQCEPVLVSLANVQPGKRRVWVEGEEIVLDTNKGREYRFGLDRCNTPEKVLKWCVHLSGKTWVTRILIRDLILLMHKVNKVPIDFGA